MRVLLAPAGSRGDFQPLLALAIGLRAAGHEAVIASGECYRAECEAFGVPFTRAGIDVRHVLESQGKRGSFTPLRATLELVRIGRDEVANFVRDLQGPCGEADLVLGGGAQIAAPTAAESAGKPYWLIGYSPLVFRSVHHPPFTLPVPGLPPIGNRLLWALSDGASSLALGGRLQGIRSELKLAPLGNLTEHFFPRSRSLLACDPELTPVPPDLVTPFPPLGSLHLEDARTLPDDLEAFLRQGPPPIYVGFGSMPDAHPDATTRLIVDAVAKAGLRAVVSAGWGGLGRGRVPSAIMPVGAVSHRLLFPRVAAVVHHGGAGTTAAAARAGKPQLVVPHAFDQLGMGRHVAAAGIGLAPISRSALTSVRLAEALQALLGAAEVARTAAALGETLRSRDPIKTLVGLLERLAQMAHRN